MNAPHWMITHDVDVAAQTPVMRQVLDAKSRHPDALILFRMGDFYELFFEDALDGSRLLDINLTSRNKNDPRPIPMCGFPWHSMSVHVQRILQAGRRCAVVEQLEDPAHAKGIVQRGVTHVITPGVVLETDALDLRRDHNILALAPTKNGGLGVAVADVSTGALQVAEVLHPTALAVLLVRLEPRELVLPVEAKPWLASAPSMRDVLQTIREVQKLQPHHTAVDAAVALLRQYVQEVRPGSEKLLQTAQPLVMTAHLALGRETVLHLELLATSRHGRRQGSLLHAVDHTCTGAGARLLRGLLLAPLADRKALELRHDAVQRLLDDRPTRQAIRDQFKHLGDLARLATRAAAGLSQPREIATLRDTLATLPALLAALQPVVGSVILAGIIGDLSGFESLLADLRAGLADEPRLLLADGGVIRQGFDAQLDALVELAENSAAWLDRFEAQEQKNTGISALKVGYNRVTGYGIEIGRSRADQVPAHYHRKQTLKNTERYTTDELIAFERKVLSAQADRLARESELFRALVQRAGSDLDLLRTIAGALAQLDVHQGFAELAAQWHYVRPKWVDAPIAHLKACRHPVIEQLLPAGKFVPNDVHLRGDPPAAVLSEDVQPAQILLLTGPNMAGKSTLMRQVALAVILAQAGSFVPAESAVMGILDGVMTRIGAGDDISEGASTFMVEMRETAQLLQQASPRTLVLLDEIGRGTSTYDGLSIAWAVMETLHDANRSLCLFATHYHELTQLSEKLPRLRNAHIAVREWGHDIIFMHSLLPGPTNRSHGIAVARLAGLPQAVIDRARVLLEQLEHNSATLLGLSAKGQALRQMGLFEQAAQPVHRLPEVTINKEEMQKNALFSALAQLDLDTLSPRQAHALLGEWSERWVAADLAKKA